MTEMIDSQPNTTPNNDAILLAILNFYEAEDGQDLTKGIGQMHALGVIDVDSLETYLESEFDFGGLYNEDTLKYLFGCLLLEYPVDNVLPAPVDAEISYDGDNTMSIGLSVYVNVFGFKQANLTFKYFFAKLSEINTLGRVVDILQNVSSEAFRIMEYLTAGCRFQVILWQEEGQEAPSICKQ
ncbi:hypothetical protein Psch_03528 [Pelotomaculum schinkii]|uniref:Uncharacterized protein n=1 Tax=Pelotomaculum schinkii TaxID=78350 RepID=A0A4Y7R7M5_9FIRM|nr:hypothetical protein [Pelotomaculum schinkii]TEB04766.1 hypothetical protein Psch_03528 [Pelotomaculum schinkii]